MSGDKVFSLGSLFSGIGGLELGLEMTGRFKTVWQVEKDAYCRKVLAKHWPEVTRYEDVKDVGKENLPSVDVICGGYPCQPFSIAGLMQGTSDERHLWPEFARVLHEIRPRYAILENVPNHLAIGFGDVLRDLAGIGYDAEWEVLSAADVGAPQLRQRIFVIAYACRERSLVEPQRVAWSSNTVESYRNGANRNVADSASHGRRTGRLCSEVDGGNDGTGETTLTRFAGLRSSGESGNVAYAKCQRLEGSGDASGSEEMGIAGRESFGRMELAHNNEWCVEILD